MYSTKSLTPNHCFDIRSRNDVWRLSRSQAKLSFACYPSPQQAGSRRSAARTAGMSSTPSTRLTRSGSAKSNPSAASGRVTQVRGVLRRSGPITVGGLRHVPERRVARPLGVPLYRVQASEYDLDTPVALLSERLQPRGLLELGHIGLEELVRLVQQHEQSSPRIRVEPCLDAAVNLLTRRDPSRGPAGRRQHLAASQAVEQRVPDRLLVNGGARADADGLQVEVDRNALADGVSLGLELLGCTVE